MLNNFLVAVPLMLVMGRIRGFGKILQNEEGVWQELG
jgi:hypothetical protein